MTEEEDQFAGMPLQRWRGMDVYTDGTSVLLRDANRRQVFGFRTNGICYEIVDGDEYELEGFVPEEWAVAHGGGAVWG